MNSVYQLRLMVSLQNQASAGLGRIRRDIRTLGVATESANARQMALAEKAAKQQARLQTVNDRINKMTGGSGNIQGLIRQHNLDEKSNDIIRRRNDLIQKEQALTSSLIGKNQNLAKAREAVAKAESDLGPANLARINSNLARQDRLRTQLKRTGLTPLGINQLMQKDNFNQFGDKRRPLLRDLKAAQLQAANLNRELGREAGILERANAALSLQRTELGTIDGELATIEAQYVKIDAQIAKLPLEQQLVAAKVLEETAALEKDIALRKTINGQIAETVRLQGIAAEEAAKPSGRLPGLARTASHVGRAGLLGGGGALLALGATANKFATFDVAAAKTATQLRGVGESMGSAAGASGKLETRILSMTRKFPAGATDMANAAYEIASGMTFAGNSGNRLTQTMKILQISNKAAVAGQTDLASATSTVVTLLNNFDPALKNVPKDLNKLFAIVRFGRGNFSEFASIFGRLAAGAHSAGATLREAGGALAYLSQVLPRSQAAVGLTRLYQIMARKEFIVGMKALGVPITMKVNGVEKLKPLSEIIKEVIQNSPKLKQGGIALQNFVAGVTAKGQEVITGKPGKGLQGTDQARKVFTALIKGYPQYRETLLNVIRDNNEADTSFKKISESPGFKWQLAKAQFQAFAITIGQTVLPILARLLGWIVNLIHGFENLSPHTRKLIGHFVAFAAIAVTVGGAILTIVGPIAGLILSFRTLSGGLGGKSGLLARVFTLRGLLMGLARIGLITIGIKFLTTGDKGAKGFFEKVGGAAAVGFGVGGPFGALAASAATLGYLGGDAAHKWQHPHEKQQNAAIDKYSADITRVQNALKKNPTAWKRMIGRQIEDSTLAGFKQLLSAGKYQQAANIVDAYLKEVGIKIEHAKHKSVMDIYNKNLTDQTGGVKKNALLKYLQNQLNDVSSQNTATADRAIQRAGERAQAITDATTKAIDNIKTKLQVLSDTYNKFRDANKNVLGDIFTPPQDSFGLNIVSGIYGNLAKFGVVPPASLIAKITTARVEAFKKADANFIALRKRGASQAFIDSLKAQGDQGVIIAKSLTQGPRSALRTVLKNFNLGQKLVEKASTVDFTNALKHWKTYGERAADAIVQGLLSKNKGLADQFKNFVLPKVDEATDAWIRKTFPDIIAKARAAAAASFDKTHPKPTKPGIPSGKGSGNGNTTINHNSPVQIIASGATVGAVAGAIQQGEFRRRTKRRPGGGGGGGGFGGSPAPSGGGFG